MQTNVKKFIRSIASVKKRSVAEDRTKIEVTAKKVHVQRSTTRHVGIHCSSVSCEQTRDLLDSVRSSIIPQYYHNNISLFNLYHIKRPRTGFHAIFRRPSTLSNLDLSWPKLGFLSVSSRHQHFLLFKPHLLTFPES